MKRKYWEIDEIEKSYEIETVVRQILNAHPEFRAYESKEVINFRCNVCGDSQSNEHKKRGFIIKEKPWRFYCHNCTVGHKITTWIRKYFPMDWEELKSLCRDDSQQSTTGTSYKNIATLKEEEVNEAEIIKTFKPILKYPEVVEYCEKRKISEAIYSKWFYCEEGKFKNRMIIPFYNAKGKIYYYQGRSMKSWLDPKYKSRKGNKFISVYNYYLADRSKEVPVLEGPIDSTFVENSIAVTGLKVGDDRLADFPNRRFMLDNDVSGRAKSKKLLDKGEYVFMWSKFLENYKYDGKIKDVNDFVLSNKDGVSYLTWDMIAPYFTNRKFDSILFMN